MTETVKNRIMIFGPKTDGKLRPEQIMSDEAKKEGRDWTRSIPS